MPSDSQHNRPRPGLLLLSVALLCGCPGRMTRPVGTGGSGYADAVYYARVVTLDDDLPEAEAVCVRDGQIVYVGDTDGAAPWLGRGTRAVDWSEHVLYPGLTDAHGHLAGLGEALASLDLTGAGSFDEVLARVRAAARASPRGWVLGRGWDDTRWRGGTPPGAAALDEAVPDRPVALTRVDGHALLVSSTALEQVGIDSSTKDPPGGLIARDPGTGEPTGLLLDRAMELVREHIRRPTPDELERLLERALAHLATLGLTEVHDAGTDVATLGALERLARKKALPLRVYAMIDLGTETGRLLVQRPPRVGEFGHRLTVRAVKLLADGALGSRGAWLSEPYADAPGTTGLAVTPPHELMALAGDAHSRGYQVAIHAIGDAANRTALHVFEVTFSRELRRADGVSPRCRIEHAQVFDPEEYHLAAALGVIASMQPLQATDDMAWTEQRLGPERVRWAHAWRSLMDNGIRLAFGSDFPIVDASPLRGIHAATTRTDERGLPHGGWLPHQRLTVAEALRAYTRGAAWAAFEEDLRGSVSVGKLADFTVLDTDLLAGEPEDVLQARVVATVVGGEVVWEAR